MRKHLATLGGIATALAVFTASPAVAQSYDWRDRYDSTRTYDSNRVMTSRDEDLLDSVHDLMSEVEANRNDLRVAFFNSALRNLRSIEDNIENARRVGGLTNRQFAQNRNLLNRTETRVQNELRTVRRYDDDGRYANRW